MWQLQALCVSCELFFFLVPVHTETKKKRSNKSPSFKTTIRPPNFFQKGLNLPSKIVKLILVPTSFDQTNKRSNYSRSKIITFVLKISTFRFKCAVYFTFQTLRTQRTFKVHFKMAHKQEKKITSELNQNINSKNRAASCFIFEICKTIIRLGFYLTLFFK